MNTHIWALLTYRDVEALDKTRTTLVLPLASTEQHGEHLPLETDSAILDGVIAHVCARLTDDEPVYFLPMIRIGKSVEHLDFCGTLSVSSATLSATIMDVARSVKAAGFQRLVLINSHGGNRAVIESSVRDIRQELGLCVGSCMWSAFINEGAYFPNSPDGIHDIHGGAFETSAMLYLRPEQVRTDRIKSYPTKTQALNAQTQFVGYYDKPLALGWVMKDVQADGATGDVPSASADIGKHIINDAADRIVVALREFVSIPTA